MKWNSEHCWHALEISHSFLISMLFASVIVASCLKIPFRFWQTKEDDMLRYKLDRIPFLEEKVRKVRENGKLVCLDINQLMLSQENRFAFTMEVAEEANAYLEKHRHEYGLKKPILHVLSDRMNEAGFSRPEGYLYPYPIKPGPYFIKEEGHWIESHAL